MVGMHAGQVTHRVPHIELNHADDTPVDIVITLDVKKDSLSVLLAAVKGASGQVLDKSDPLSDFHL